MKLCRCIPLTLLLTLLAATQAWAQPPLNGMATNVELGQERFIAALYSERLSEDAETILNANVPRSMELKVVDDSLSARSLNSMWIEGMAINNNSSQLEAQAENLAKLTNMIRKRLVSGDTLRFDAVPGEGMTISLNGVELGTINSDEFFPFLLRTWIGPIPLSSKFKDELLAGGDVESDLVGRYQTIEPDPTRVDVVASWTAPAPEAPSTPNDAAEEESGVTPPPPSVSVDPPPGANTQTAEASEPEPDPEPAEQQVAAAPQAPEDENTAQVADSEPAAPANRPEPEPVESQPEPEPEPPQEQQQQVARAEPPPAPAPEEEEEQETFSAAGLLARQYYVSDSLIAIRKNVRYPRRALEREREGSVRLAVTVDRDGEVLEIRPVEEARYGILTRAAREAVEDTDPLPDLPQEMSGESFTFTVPISFQLAN